MDCELRSFFIISRYVNGLKISTHANTILPYVYLWRSTLDSKIKRLSSKSAKKNKTTAEEQEKQEKECEKAQFNRTM